MPEEQFKRHIAYKLRIKDITIGKPIIDGERFSFLELGNKRIVREIGRASCRERV